MSAGYRKFDCGCAEWWSGDGWTGGMVHCGRRDGTCEAEKFHVNEYLESLKGDK